MWRLPLLHVHPLLAVLVPFESPALSRSHIDVLELNVGLIWQVACKEKPRSAALFQ